MNHAAPTDHPVHALIEQRWSPYAFADRPVAAEILASVLEAARWAPSSFNEQPWRFIVGQHGDSATFQRLLDCLVPANQEWAKAAPVLLISVAAMSFARNGKPNRHAAHDGGLASGQLALQATALGLAVHFMAGFDGDKARETFAIPDGFEPVAAIAMGYHEDVSADSEAETAMRHRRTVESFAFHGEWETAGD